MRIVPIACLKDNYAYLVICEETGRRRSSTRPSTSPSSPPRSGEGLSSSRSGAPTITSTTSEGNEGVIGAGDIREVAGHASDRGRVPGQTRFVETGDVVTVGSVSARVTHIPGHTLGAVAYFVEGPKERAVFTGDTLFLAGCGRLFEGTPAQMHASLSSLATLPPDTRVSCGHEYTAANLRFAHHVEPSNTAVDDATAGVASEREAGRPSIPGTLAREIATNPFLRVRSPEIRRTLGISGEADDVTAFATIRKAKDEFRG